MASFAVNERPLYAVGNNDVIIGSNVPIPATRQEIANLASLTVLDALEDALGLRSLNMAIDEISSEEEKEEEEEEKDGANEWKAEKKKTVMDPKKKAEQAAGNR